MDQTATARHSIAEPQDDVDEERDLLLAGFARVLEVEAEPAPESEPADTAWRSTWHRDGFDLARVVSGDFLLKIELPLMTEDGKNLGTLWLVKDLEQECVTHYTLRRIEHLRRTLIRTLVKLK